MVDSKKFAVKLLMGAMQYASGQLAEMDDSFKQKLEGIDTVIQWKVEPDGPNSYTVVKNSKIEGKMDAVHDKPTYSIVLKSADVALDLLRGQLDAEKAIADGKMNIVGDLTIAMKQMFILADLGEYLADLTGGG
ncbi:MAG: SCP2 sterol-binding domain-containing protein [Candidatus Helarchaeota archaeon]|nr:SCP2 sterol-binding domain-containing protein [Candidatus Helarchaeota archaeon]